MKRPDLDRAAIAPELRRLERRLMLKGMVSLGGLAMLSGCVLDDEPAVERALARVMNFTDRAQALLFSRHRLAREFDASRITRPFPFNAYYGQDEVRTVDPAQWRLEVSGLVTDTRPWSLARFRALPQKRQITRHICVEGWSAIGCWSGVPLSVFLQHVGADLRAKYVDFHCFDDYSTSIDMATALHPQTIMVLDFDDAALPAAYGAPMKVRIPTKLGYKNPKYLAAITVTNRFPGGYWEDQGYDWFGGS
ncbi:molybdopterin-dependent oxidoreductase [Gluconacetobacter diazotrophicus]|uniref:Molybdopterin-dependent oxidoreductase n=2 Tax=Gluconacetobacter diazotrophicus TaxID=33996 RepID=A0A7W4I5S4_GLUDI|nr:molybdopterin-dependent oxidoreductase [Gluconacetobacter diazotrophicus]MBB2156787.1 molybdopterin-dependent oxidoreductase [Gluconacetobacter diazotrophicus]CAP57563.1 putative oxidoreductase protein [Gluconacetobacter diazotrophicus PA1 5]